MVKITATKISIPLLLPKGRFEIKEVDVDDLQYASHGMLFVDNDYRELLVRFAYHGILFYAPHRKSEKWVLRRIQQFLADHPNFTQEPRIPGIKVDMKVASQAFSDSFEAVRDTLMKSLMEPLDFNSMRDWGNARNDSALEPTPLTTDEIEKTLDEVSALGEMSKWIDGRIDDKLWVDFTVPQGTTVDSMKFRMRYLKMFAAEVAADTYWKTRTDILGDRALLVDTLVKDAHNAAVKAGWYKDPVTGEEIQRNFGEMIALAHSELSEALEADRKDLMDDKLPQYHGTFVELIDLMIRDLDTLGMLRDRLIKRGFEAPSVGQIYVDKRAFNDERADHKLENRAKGGGKAY